MNSTLNAGRAPWLAIFALVAGLAVAAWFLFAGRPSAQAAQGPAAGIRLQRRRLRLLARHTERLGLSAVFRDGGELGQDPRPEPGQDFTAGGCGRRSTSRRAPRAEAPRCGAAGAPPPRLMRRPESLHPLLTPSRSAIRSAQIATRTMTARPIRSSFPMDPPIRSRRRFKAANATRTAASSMAPASPITATSWSPG